VAAATFSAGTERRQTAVTRLDRPLADGRSRPMPSAATVLPASPRLRPSSSLADGALASAAGDPQGPGVRPDLVAWAARGCFTPSASSTSTRTAASRTSKHRSEARGLTADPSALSEGLGVVLVSAGPSAAKTQGADLGGAKGKPEDAGRRSVPGAPSARAGSIDRSPARRRGGFSGVRGRRGGGTKAANPADLVAVVVVGAPHNATAPGTTNFCTTAPPTDISVNRPLAALEEQG
jgi:hypothetical protein